MDKVSPVIIPILIKTVYYKHGTRKSLQIWERKNAEDEMEKSTKSITCGVTLKYR